MKNFLYYVSFFLVVTVLAVACKDPKKNETPKFETVTLDIKGMTCAIGCAKTIESKIAKIEGVSKSVVNFDEKVGTFTFDANKTNAKEIITTINGLLDGKTYTSSTHLEKSCNTACAEKCEHLAEKSCKEKCEKSCDSKNKEKSCHTTEKESCCKQ